MSESSVLGLGQELWREMENISLSLFHTHTHTISFSLSHSLAHRHGHIHVHVRTHTHTYIHIHAHIRTQTCTLDQSLRIPAHQSTTSSLLLNTLTNLLPLPLLSSSLPVCLVSLRPYYPFLLTKSLFP